MPAFLFDLDGVLIDSEREYTRIWQTIEERFPTGVQNFTKKIKGTTLPNILDTYFPDSEVRSQVEKMLYELEQKMIYTYCPGAKEFLDKLKTRGIRMALVTSSNDIKMRHLYRDIPEIRSYFVKIIDDRCVTRSKPDPQGYLLGAEACEENPCKCVVVEDSLQGVKAGEAAGAFVIGVEGTLPAETIAPHCRQVVSNLTQVDIDSIIRQLDLSD